ncbi:MAG: hypothetical protein KJO79_08660 [Verrucomicrobiae bacterium]|nr:hypothetical protein [Verrucomicrobiae bacterium]NNJ87237.1 hypothetical protein [Akkermansiaceae bacterium]
MSDEIQIKHTPMGAGKEAQGRRKNGPLVDGSHRMHTAHNLSEFVENEPHGNPYMNIITHQL